ncbi:hypothetical protein [Pseudomonas sp.]|uniref:hypothetical protein n=1 Tax=Pseudomonas sp. TaxID=306 RepID=UPI00289C0634|nr:hypothetical protein [Pseudomonas sp.]
MSEVKVIVAACLPAKTIMISEDLAGILDAQHDRKMQEIKSQYEAMMRILEERRQVQTINNIKGI